VRLSGREMPTRLLRSIVRVLIVGFMGDVGNDSALWEDAI
jgi:hypothetical protein